MRLKEFLIFLLVFTIIYILFFIIIDFISLRISSLKQKSKALKLINITDYQNFAAFYGINSTITGEVIKNIFLDIQKSLERKISIAGQKYGITPYEYVVIVLYLELLELVTKKDFSFEKDLISEYNFQDKRFVDKYLSYFINGCSYDEIVKIFGKNSYNDLYYIDKYFLLPGIRFINGNIYYYRKMGD